MRGDGVLGATTFSFWQQSTQPDCVSFYLCKHQKGKLPAMQGVSLFEHCTSRPRQAHVLLPSERHLMMAARKQLHPHFGGN
jgi:hypothetical protein